MVVVARVVVLAVVVGRGVVVCTRYSSRLEYSSWKRKWRIISVSGCSVAGVAGGGGGGPGVPHCWRCSRRERSRQASIRHRQDWVG